MEVREPPGTEGYDERFDTPGCRPEMVPLVPSHRGWSAGKMVEGPGLNSPHRFLCRPREHLSFLDFDVDLDRINSFQKVVYYCP